MKVRLRNSGTRAAFVKTVCYSGTDDFFLEFCFFSFIFSLPSQMILIYLRSLWEEICCFTICSFVSSLVTVTI